MKQFFSHLKRASAQYHDFRDLMAGSIGAQLVLLVTMLIVARYVSPAEMGVFIKFASAVALISIPASMAFDQIIMEVDEREIAPIMGLVLALSTLVSAVVVVGLYFLDWLPVWSLALVIATVVATNAFDAARNWCIRNKNFRDPPRGVIGSNIGRLVVSWLALQVTAGAMALILADVIARFMGILAQRSWGMINAGVNVILHTPSVIWWTAKRHLRRASPLMMAAWLDVALFWAPLSLVTWLYGTEVGGQLAIAQRVMTAIPTLLRRNLADVYHSRLGGTRDPVGVTIKLLSAIALVGIAAWVVLWFSAVPLFSALFGRTWAAAGEMAILIAPLAVLEVTYGVMTRLMIRINREGVRLVGGVALLIAVLAGPISGYALGFAALASIAVMSASVALVWLVWLVAAIYVAREHYGTRASV